MEVTYPLPLTIGPHQRNIINEAVGGDGGFVGLGAGGGVHFEAGKG